MYVYISQKNPQSFVLKLLRWLKSNYKIKHFIIVIKALKIHYPIDLKVSPKSYEQERNSSTQT